MKKVILCSIGLLCILSEGASVALQHRPLERPAAVSVVHLSPNAPLSFQPKPGSDFVLVALQDCSLLIDEKIQNLQRGDFEQINGDHSLELDNVSLKIASVVLIEVKKRDQNLTIAKTTLASRQELEDASDRNATLLVALSNVVLRDVHDLNDEGKTWKSSTPLFISLSLGQTAWLKPGSHRLRNLRNAAVRFVMIEW